MYLLDQDGHFLTGQDLLAADEVEALQVSACVVDACSEVARRFELWEGKRLLFECHDCHALAISLEIIRQRHTKTVLEVEDRIAVSMRALARSQRLLMIRQSMLSEMMTRPNHSAQAHR